MQPPRRPAGHPRGVGWPPLALCAGVVVGLAAWYLAPLSLVVAPRLTRGPAVTEDSALAGEIRTLLASAPGKYGIAIRDGASGRGLLLSERETFAAASLYKLGVLYEVYRRADAGRLSLDEQLTLRDPALLDDEPPGGVALGETVTIAEAARRMTIVSSNAAARLLVARLGRASVNRELARAGWHGTRLSTGLPGWIPVVGREYSVTSALDVLAYFEALRRGELISPRASAQLRALLEDQRVNDRIPEPLPDGVRVAHKTGDLDAVSHDAGIVATDSGGYVIVVLTQDAGPDTARGVIRQIARLAYRRYAGAG